MEIQDKDEKINVINVTTAKPENHIPELSADGGPRPKIKVEFDQVEGIPKNLVGPIQWDHPKSAHVKVIDRGKGLVERTRSKVCIVGYAENSRHLAWFEDPDAEIWGVNQLNRFIPRADRWFQVHTNWDDKDRWAPGTDQKKWLAECPIPIYMTDINPNIPNSISYPYEWVMQELKVHDYFTSSIAFMVALAIAEGFKEIGIYGIDLIIGREYFFEKACVEFYLGIAQQRGIEYHLPEGCALLWQSHRYGYQKQPSYGFFGLDKLAARKSQLHKQVKQMRDDLYTCQGRLDEAMFLRDKLAEHDRPKMDKRMGELQQKVDGMLNAYYLHEGACQEVARMHGILETKSRGGQVE